ncbi:hypothetical protein UPYG_G00223320 [Umbra pygmaea]|uniref:Uncharacterized protein n=1 Tax=Umbra pygmaea TaxID=75934 RepID=A0ABD0WU74_UMBPY
MAILINKIALEYWKRLMMISEDHDSDEGEYQILEEALPWDTAQYRRHSFDMARHINAVGLKNVHEGKLCWISIKKTTLIRREISSSGFREQTWETEAVCVFATDKPGSKDSDYFTELSKDHNTMTEVLFGKEISDCVIQDPGVLVDFLPVITKRYRTNCVSDFEEFLIRHGEQGLPDVSHQALPLAV